MISFGGDCLDATGNQGGDLSGGVCTRQLADAAGAFQYIVNLAGIPSIVYGLFGLGAFVLFMQFGTSIWQAPDAWHHALPVVISTAEEAILAVPQRFRVTSLSLGRPSSRPPLPGTAPGTARYPDRRHPGAEPRRR
jgi:hypothetical protein